MAIDPIDAIRRFEPILYFHRDETFFPSDAKRYLERSAFWDVRGTPRDDKGRWGGVTQATLPHFPLIRRGKILARAGEDPFIAEADDGVPGTFLGDAGAEIRLADTPQEERFLDFVGWQRGGRAVNHDSENRYADFPAATSIYAVEGTSLSESRFWYHAEVFGTERLRRLAEGRAPLFTKKLSALKNPALVCYYLFFPGHLEGLAGCRAMHGKYFWASCVGAWSCVAVLLEGDDTETTYQPVMIGLTSRNAGRVEFLGEEIRLGMRTVQWELATKVLRDRGAGRPQGEHPRIFVSLGTHGLYLTRDEVPARRFSPEDVSDESCGAFETQAAYLAASRAHREERAEDEELIAIKHLLPAAIGALNSLPWAGVIGGALGGAILGFGAAMAEFGGMSGLAGLQDPPDRTTSDKQKDHPPTLDETGTVIHPVGVDPPEAPEDGRQTWPRFDPADETKLDDVIDGRTYSLWVANKDEPESRPIWLPNEDPNVASFRGRWGNRVVSDPFNRRAGMRFPEFWSMFIDAIGR